VSYCDVATDPVNAVGHHSEKGNDKGVPHLNDALLLKFESGRETFHCYNIKMKKLSYLQTGLQHPADTCER
jgi:hypothetical protein